MAKAFFLYVEILAQIFLGHIWFWTYQICGCTETWLSYRTPNLDIQHKVGNIWADILRVQHSGANWFLDRQVLIWREGGETLWGNLGVKLTCTSWIPFNHMSIRHANFSIRMICRVFIFEWAILQNIAVCHNIFSNVTSCRVFVCVCFCLLLVISLFSALSFLGLFPPFLALGICATLLLTSFFTYFGRSSLSCHLPFASFCDGKKV